MIPGSTPLATRPNWIDDALAPAATVLGATWWLLVAQVTDTGMAHRFAALVLVVGGLSRLLAVVRRADHERRRLTEVAGTDALTGLDNRRRFFEQAERCVARSSLGAEPIGALMIDVDHFKRINDTYGHAGGDAVLVELARRCALAVRPTDLIGRLGGDELAVILPGCDPEGVAVVAARLREFATGRPIEASAGRQASEEPVTISIGAAAGRFGSLEEALEMADAALYDAKRAGRDGFRVAAPSIAVE